MPLSQFIQERIFTPLGMTDSAFIVSPEKRDRLAQPFATDPATNTPIKLLDVTVPQKNDAGGAGGGRTAAGYAPLPHKVVNRRPPHGPPLFSPTPGNSP